MLLAVGLLMALPTFGQTVRGLVVEAGTEKPLPGVVVRMIDTGGRTLAYQMADREGRFRLSVPSGADTLRVSLLGFREKVFLRPFRDQYYIALQAAPQQIRAAVVEAAKVEVEGDTIRYSVNALKTREDLVLSDVLKRLPGVEVTRAGFVKYNGQAINRFYVDGRDILESNYNLATQNLSVDAVKAVEVLENHQPVRILRGLKSSASAALNIVLNEEARAKVNWGLSAGVGAATDAPRYPLSGKASAFYMGSRFSSMNAGGYDSQGNALQDQDLAEETDRGGNHISLRPWAALSSPTAPLEDKRSLFNRSLDLSTIERYSISEDVSLGTTVKYASDALSSLLENTSVYQDPVKGETVIDRTESHQTAKHHIVGILSYTENGSKRYVTDRLYADLDRNDGNVLASGDLDRRMQAARRAWNVENDGALGIRADGKVFVLESFTQFSGTADRLSVSAGPASQTVEARQAFQRLALSGLNGRQGRWKYRLSPVLSGALYERTGLLVGLDENLVPGIREAGLSVVTLQAGLPGEISYKGPPFEMSLEEAIRYVDYRIDGTDCGRWTGSISARMKYVTGRWESSIVGMAGIHSPDIQELGESIILTGYNSLWRGRSSLLFVPYGQLSSSFLYREPVSGWNVRASVSYNASWGSASARELYEGYILGYFSDEMCGVRGLSIDAEVSKGIYSINGKASAGVSYGRTESLFRQSGVSVDYSSHFLTPVFSLSATAFGIWGIVADGRINFYRYQADEVSDTVNAALRLSVRNTVFLSKALSAGITTDVYHYSSFDKTIVFPDMAFVWKSDKGLRLRLEANNLLDHRHFYGVMLSPLLEESFSYRIRPLTVLLGVDWRF